MYYTGEIEGLKVSPLHATSEMDKLTNEIHNLKKIYDFFQVLTIKTMYLKTKDIKYCLI